MFMAVHARAKRFDRIVEMERNDASESDVFVEFVEGPPIVLFAREVVAGGERVLGIEAQAKSLMFLTRKPPQAQCASSMDLAMVLMPAASPAPTWEPG